MTGSTVLTEMSADIPAGRNIMKNTAMPFKWYLHLRTPFTVYIRI